MPWENKTMSEIRKEFVERVLSKEKHKCALCKEYGISRPTGDKWIKRYLNGESMDDRSRRPFKTPNRISEEMEREIVEMRIKEPAIGAVKTRRMMADKGKNPPSAKTINNVFKRNGLITKEASLAATPAKRFEKSECNEMWQADFKGDYLLKNNVRCYPLSIVDDHSRFCLNSDAKYGTKLVSTKESFIRAFEEYGLPFSLLCDNGVPWGASQSGSITKFEVWLMELGVLPIHIRCKHPQTQGKVERFNGSFKRERLKYYIPKNMEDADKQRQEYRRFYNEERPHHALDLKTPSQVYSQSSRKYPQIITPWDYEAGTDIRKIKNTGYLTFNGRGYYCSEGLADKEVAIVPSKTDGRFNILFRQFRIAVLNEREGVIVSKRIYLIHDDPRFKKM